MTIITASILLVVLAGLGLIVYACRAWFVKHWRAILSILPLPMLALAASYGVYSFATLFAPTWVAVAQAAAFEMTYIGLATLDKLDQAQRKRASNISVGAVIVSIIYNSLAGIGHRNPAMFADLPWYSEWVLGILHGAPLAIVAYCVSDLLLHRPSASKSSPASKAPEGEKSKSSLRPVRTRPQAGQVSILTANGHKRGGIIAAPVDEITHEIVRLHDDDKLSFTDIGKRLGFSRQAAQQRYNAAKEVVNAEP